MQNRQTRLDILLSLLFGLLACWLVVGFLLIEPQNLGWIQHGDPVTHYLGWSFFRHDGWHWPLGLNPNYGLELSSSIVYSDSIPLLAIPFKWLGSILPNPFQYFGLWILGCFVLQAWFASRLMRLITPNSLLVWLGALFFLFSPPMIWRLHPFIGHLSLVGHFLILAALYLSLRPVRSHCFRLWGVLLVVAILVHAYLFALVALIWAADLVSRSRMGEQPELQVLKEFIGLLALLLLAAWMAGYLEMGGEVSTDQYGVIGLNLYSLVDPGIASYGLWSTWLPDLPEGVGHESFMYLGSGLLALLILLPMRLFFKNTWLPWSVDLARWMPLILLVVLLTLFALSHRLHIGDVTQVVVDFKSLPGIFGAFRASPRFFWPVYYLIIWGVLWVILKSCVPRNAVVLMVLAVLLQGYDIFSGVRPIRAHYTQPVAKTLVPGLNDPFWQRAASHYRQVRLIPSVFSDTWHLEQIYPLAIYADAYRLATNAVYLARYPEQGVERETLVREALLSGGGFDIETLYVFDDAHRARFLAAYPDQRSALRRVDGLNVFAPNAATLFLH